MQKLLVIRAWSGGFGHPTVASILDLGTLKETNLESLLGDGWVIVRESHMGGGGETAAFASLVVLEK